MLFDGLQGLMRAVVTCLNSYSAMTLERGGSFTVIGPGAGPVDLLRTVEQIQ